MRQHGVDALGPRPAALLGEGHRVGREMPEMFVAQQRFGRHRLYSRRQEDVARGGQELRRVAIRRQARAFEHRTLTIEKDAAQFAGRERLGAFLFQSGSKVTDGAIDRFGPRHLRHEGSVVDGVIDGFLQRLDPFAFRRHGAHDGHAEMAREKGRFDADVRLVGGIGHVQRNDERQAEVGHLRG